MMDWLNTQFYRDFGYGLVYPQLFPHHKRRSDEAHAGAIAWGAGLQELAADSQRPLDRTEKPVSRAATSSRLRTISAPPWCRSGNSSAVI